MNYIARLVQQSELSVAEAPQPGAPAVNAAGEASLEEVEVFRPAEPGVAAVQADARGAAMQEPPAVFHTESLSPDSVETPPAAWLPEETTSILTPRPAEPSQTVAGEGTGPADEATEVITRERVLERVFAWIAAGNPAAVTPEPAPSAVAGLEQEATREVSVRASAAEQPAAAAETRPAPAPAAVPVRMVRPPDPDIVALDEEEPARASTTVRPEPARAATRVVPAAESLVEEVFTVSIGAISVRVEAPPAAAPPPAPRPATPQPARNERRSAARRLARHYLRP